MGEDVSANYKTSHLLSTPTPNTQFSYICKKVYHRSWHFREFNYEYGLIYESFLTPRLPTKIISKRLPIQNSFPLPFKVWFAYWYRKKLEVRCQRKGVKHSWNCYYYLIHDGKLCLGVLWIVYNIRLFYDIMIWLWLLLIIVFEY